MFSAVGAATAQNAQPIPAALNECFQLLNQQIPAVDIAQLRRGGWSAPFQQQMAQVVSHVCIDPPAFALVNYFRARGIDHPADMTSIVVTTYGRWLRPERMLLDEMITARRNYQRNLPTPQKLAVARQLMNLADADESLLPAAYKAAETLVSQAFDGTNLQLPSLSGPMMQLQWQALGRFVLWRVGTAPAVEAAQYDRAVGEIDPSLKLNSVRLDPDTLLMDVDAGGVGDVMVFNTAPGQAQRVWHIGAAAGEERWRSELSCWAPSDGHDRPCFPRMSGALPTDASGAPRFYVSAGYAQAAGCTAGAQLTIWRWTGQVAEPIYANTYSTYCDGTDQGAQLRGDTFRVREKGSFKVLLACGACAGRQLEHRIQITRSGVADLGTTSLTPQLDLVDELFARIKAGQDPGDLIDAPAFAKLRQYWAPLRAQRFQQLFLNEPQTVGYESNRETLCFLAHYGDNSLPPMLFTFSGRGATLRVTSMRENSPGCSR
jgi:hypothetical protein